MRERLTKQQVIAAIERKGGEKVPVVFHKWWGNGLEDKYGKELYDMANKYPDDIYTDFYNAPGTAKSSSANPSYRWGYKDYTNTVTHSIGHSHELLPDWDELDDFLADFPDPNEPGNFDWIYDNVKKCPDDKYKLGCFWCLFHERFWSIRGMENLMMDYYDNMDGLRIIGNKLLEFYKVIVDKYADAGFDGIFTSDDLGHQSGPMMSPAVFKELYLPLYKEFIDHVHSKGMHVFLHSCGDNTKLMPYLIEAGLDVFHPIQVGCMDMVETAKNFGDKISFLAGVDVQHLLPDEDVNGVINGVENMIDILYKPQGGLLLACGNGIMPDTPLENIDAMLNTISTYIPKDNK